MGGRRNRRPYTCRYTGDTMQERNRRNNYTDSQDEETTEGKIPRRSFIQAAGAVAGAGMLGFGAIGTAAADEFDPMFTQRRVREARKVWAMGFRGQADRTLGILSDGLGARHPDVGPWNGVRAIPDGDGGLELVHENLERLDVPEDIRFFAESRALPSNTGDRHEYQFTGPENVYRVEAHSKSEPSAQSNGVRLSLETADGEVIESFAGNAAPHTGIAAKIEPAKNYVFVIENTMRSVRGTYNLEAQYFANNPDGKTDPFANVDPDSITADTPKVLGWYNEDYSISEPHAKPRSGPHLGGKGVHLASLMAGSGRASTVDESTIIRDDPQKFLIIDDDPRLEYEVEAEPGRNVFAVASGDYHQVRILDPEGNVIGYTSSPWENTHTICSETTPTVHSEGKKTYTIQIEPLGDNQCFGILPPCTPGRVNQVCVGATKPPDATAGDRTEKGENPTLHAGIAPNVGLVGLSGWRKTRKDLKRIADDLVRLFNLRVLTVSLGFGNDLGIAGGKLSNGSIGSFKVLAETGVLTISHPPAASPPSFPDRAPAGADESISVVETGPWDGITEENRHEPAALDEDKKDVYRKPDVTAPGSIPSYPLQAALSGDAWLSEEEQDPIRDYDGLTNYAVNTPFVAGTAGLVAQALEEKAPDSISLPPPEQAGLTDTMQLKQTILATASETPFTASKWHKLKPSYDFGGHDPIEGWGRVNVDAAVEAASRNLTPGSALTDKNASKGLSKRPNNVAERASRGGGAFTKTVEETVGLKLPKDSRAVAGYISGVRGTYEVSVKFSHYTGEDKTRASAPPHIDVFIYDAVNPGKHGTPNIVAKAQALTGTASLRFESGHNSSGESEDGTYYVVAKLVNVPGGYNSNDIQAKFSLSVAQIDTE